MSRIRSKRPKFLLLLEYGLYRCFESLFQYLPPTWVDRMGMALGSAAFHLLSGRRAIVARNLRIAWGDSLSDDEWRKLTKQVFQRNGANLLGGTRCMIMDDAELEKHFTLEGADLVHAHLSQGQSGAIFTLCHMGNWEILARIAHLIAPGVPAGAFYRPLNNPWMNRMTKRRRQRSGTKLFSNKEGLSQASPLLRSGGILGILADQHAGRTGSLCTFFGRPTTCSPLVEVLQRRTGAAVFYIAIVRDAPAHWRIKISAHPIEQVIDTPHIMAHVEKSLSLSPADGFWFHNRWKLVKRTPLRHPYSRQCLDPSLVTKPCRWLFVLSENAQIAEASLAAVLAAARQSEHTTIDVISPISVETHDLPLVCHPRQEALTRQMQQFAADSRNPIDLIVYFCDVEEIPTSLSWETDLVTVGMAPQKTKRTNITIISQGSLFDSTTWLHYVKQMGVPDSFIEEIPNENGTAR